MRIVGRPSTYGGRAGFEAEKERERGGGRGRDESSSEDDSEESAAEREVKVAGAVGEVESRTSVWPVLRWRRSAIGAKREVEELAAALLLPSASPAELLLSSPSSLMLSPKDSRFLCPRLRPLP